MIILLSILVFLLIPACTWWFGFWSNLITFVNIILAGLTASALFPLLSIALVDINPASFAFAANFVAIWAVFAITFIVLRGLTDVISRYRLKFDIATEMAGRSVMSLLASLAFVCFMNFTLQLAPLDKGLFGEDANVEFWEGSIPDRAWLGYMLYAADGPLYNDVENSIDAERFYVSTSFQRALNFDVKVRRSAADSQ